MKPKVGPSDEELLVQFYAGNEDAFETLHDRYRWQLSSYAFRILRDGDLAADVTQETIFKLFRSRTGRQWKAENVGSLLYTICRHDCFDRLKIWSIHPIEPTEEMFATSGTSGRWIDLKGCIQQLVAREREVVFLRLEGLENKEIAAALNTGDPNASKIWTRAVAKLMACMEHRVKQDAERSAQPSRLAP